MSKIHSPRAISLMAAMTVLILVMPVSPLSLIKDPSMGYGWTAEAATEGFMANVVVNDNIGTSEQSRPALELMKGTNGAYAVWQDDRDGDFDIYFALSNDGGKSWSSNIRVDDGSASTNARYPDIAEAPNGDVFVVWDDDRGGTPDIRISRSTNGGGTWGSSVRVDDSSAGYQDHARVEVGLNGHVYVIWEDGRSTGNHIWFASSGDNGTSFGSNVQVDDATADNALGMPDIAVHPNGTLVAAWEDDRLMATYNYDIYTARSTGGGGAWSASQKINDDMGDRTQRVPKLAVDGGGTVYCAWHDYRNSNYDIYMANSTDGGATFGTDTKVDDGPAGSKQTDPDISAGRKGKVVVAWTDDRNGTEDIRLTASGLYGGSFPVSMRVDDSTNDSIGGNDNSHQNYPSVGVDYSGNIYAVWTDARDGHRDIWSTVTYGGTPFENHGPELLDIAFSPDVGSTDTLFSFTVNYTDREGNPPDTGYPKLRVYTSASMAIETAQSPKTMQEVDPGDHEVTDGKLFTRSLSLVEEGADFWFVIEAKAKGGNKSLVASPPARGPLVDESEVEFFNATPLSEDWVLSQYAVWCNVSVKDHGGGGVDLSSNAIQYRICLAGESDFSEWETFYYNTSKSAIWVEGEEVRLSQMVNFIDGEGRGNCVQWRARDTVGNGAQEGFTQSPAYEISIDSFPVEFLEPYPSPDAEREEDDREVRAAITLTDNGTGVNGSSVYYRYSTSGAADEKFSDWEQAGPFPDNETVRAEVKLRFGNGYANYIQWTVQDVGGHAGTSQKYQVKVDESLNSPPSPPVVIFPNRTADRSPHISWEGSEDPEGDLIGYEIAIGTSKTKDNILEWTSTGYNAYYDVEEELRPDTYYIRVKASDYYVTSEEFVGTMIISVSGNSGPRPPSEIGPELTTETRPTITWEPGSDEDGDELSYFVAVGTEWGSVDVVDWTRTFDTFFDVPVHLDYGVFYVSVMTFDGSDYSRVMMAEMTVAFFATSCAWNDTGVEDSETTQAAGTNVSYALEVVNLGNAVDDAVVSLSGSLVGNASLWLDQGALTMDANVTYPLLLWVDLPANATPGSYSVLVEVISGNGIRTSSVYLNIDVAPANGSGGSGGGGPGTGEDGDGGGGPGLTPGDTPSDGDDDNPLRGIIETYWWMFLLIAIMVGLVISMTILTRRKKREREIWEKKEEGDDEGGGRSGRRAPRPPPQGAGPDGPGGTGGAEGPGGRGDTEGPGRRGGPGGPGGSGPSPGGPLTPGGRPPAGGDRLGPASGDSVAGLLGTGDDGSDAYRPGDPSVDDGAVPGDPRGPDA